MKIKKAFFTGPLVLTFLLTGCVQALHPYNAPSQQTLQIQTKAPEQYAIRVNDAQIYRVASDGRVTFEVPQLPRGCAVYLFGALKISDYRAEDMRVIHVLKNENNIVRRLSFNDISKLPLGVGNAHLLIVP